MTLVPLLDTPPELPPLSDDLCDALNTLPVLLVSLVDVFLEEGAELLFSSWLRELELFSEALCSCSCCSRREELLVEDLEFRLCFSVCVAASFCCCSLSCV